MNQLTRSFANVAVAALAGAALAYDYNGTPTGHLYNVYTTAQIKEKITQGWRPTSFRQELPGIFRTTLVQNAGSHQKEVRFESNMTEATLNNIRNSGWRIEDIEVTGSARYSAIFIKNNVDPRTTLWFANWTSAQIQSWLNTNNTFRVLDLDRYITGGVTRFSGVFLRNTGTAAVSGWGWMPDATLTTVMNWAKNNGMRVIDLERATNGRFAAVFAKASAGQRWYAFQGSLNYIWEQMGGLGLRIVTLNSHAAGTGRIYSATLVNNTNSQSARIADRTFPLHNGVQGFYVHQIGVTNPVVGLNHTARMHPSSSIKALIHYTGAWRTPAAELNTRIVSGLPMVTLHRNMMYNSDNPSSNTLMDAYTVTQIENVAHNVLGMSQNTQLRNRFGTGGPYGNDQITETTLADFGILYRAIQNGFLGTTKTTWLRANMNNETRSFPWNPVVSAVRTQLGITTTKFNDWAGRIRSINKAGNNGDSNDINGYWSNAGVISLPFKSNGIVTMRHYLYGHYVNRSTVSYEGTPAWTTVAELIREQIVSSMNTFK